jgi:hypothetical protein
VRDDLTGRDGRAKSAARGLGVSARRDSERLLAPTKAFDSGKVGFFDLEEAEAARKNSSAHSKPIAMSGRDLQLGIGRATPSWLGQGR